MAAANQDASVDDAGMVQAIAEVLADVVRSNEASGAVCADASTLFDGPRVPTRYPIDRYVSRLERYTMCGTPVLVSALVLLDRMAQHVPLSSRNVHRMFLASVVVSSKMQSDIYYRISFYGRCGGVPTEELAQLEVEALRLLEFRLLIGEDEFDEYASLLATRALCPPPPPHVFGHAIVAAQARFASVTAAAAARSSSTQEEERSGVVSSSPPLPTTVAPTRALDVLHACDEWLCAQQQASGAGAIEAHGRSPVLPAITDAE